ncbi:hypothetical protein EA762_15940 [Acinetobacter pittii]|uniref:AAA family ATPase n=1 Tax=Acinetobacter pittii TaxID=48296 RepID=UPI000F737629|nr:AAA family ATPase [Acinetobacter pittii]RSO15883.1 hypothetical protein EA762_15940 [Acinetobacter pittii]
MIRLINLKNVASYKSNATLETDKKINLIYGLNGAGKSTFSNFLHQRIDPKYKDCSIDGLEDDHEVLVYNQAFIQENFFEVENLKGIFTLSKENKEAETKISNALKEIKKIQDEIGKQKSELEDEKRTIVQEQNAAKETVWKIKNDYSGGDRVLEFCLDGYKGSKDNLFNYLLGLSKPNIKPQKSIDDLKNDFQSISGDNPQKYLSLPKINFSSQDIEIESLFSKHIVGNENSTVSQLIKMLGNSDWVKAGLKYIPQNGLNENLNCPFCQEKTISNILIENIKNYFDASYEADIVSLNYLFKTYSQEIQSIPNKWQSKT